VRRFGVFLAFIGVFLWAAVAGAHARSASYSIWWLDGRGATVRLSLSLLDASALEARGVHRDTLGNYVKDALTLSRAGVRCEGDAPRLSDGRAGWLDFEWHLDCAGAPGDRIESRLLSAVNPSHLHFVRVFEPTSRQAVLDVGSPALDLPRASSRTKTFFGFVRLGAEHIASGWDHLVFVLMLVVGSRGLRRTAWVVSGFTLGHSLTLSLATLGAVVTHAASIEALIGLSIALLAVENVWVEQGRRSLTLPLATLGALGVLTVLVRWAGAGGSLALGGVALFAAAYFALLRGAERPETLRAAVAALFGLVHGFGFSRVLSEMHLPTSELWRGLLGFNLGVELGQLAFVALAWWPLWLLRKSESRRDLLCWASAAALSLGTYWLVSRSFA
jgi:hypothetical protein